MRENLLICSIIIQTRERTNNLIRKYKEEEEDGDLAELLLLLELEVVEDLDRATSLDPSNSTLFHKLVMNIHVVTYAIGGGT